MMMKQTSAWWLLIDTAGSAALDRGPRPGIMSVSDLQRLLKPVVKDFSQEHRDAVMSLAWLWHDHLEEAHQLCQRHEGHQDCDYVHALLHRREGDFANANYWFREVGQHLAYSVLAKSSEALAIPDAVKQGVWQPAAMVAVCAEVIRTGKRADEREQAVALQAVEFATLAACLAHS